MENEFQNNNQEKVEESIQQEKVKIEKDKGVGPIIGSIIIIILIIIGGIYYWNSIIDERAATQDTSEQSEAESISEIEAELNTTDLDNLDAELEQIEAEFEAEIQQN